jgi:N-methylhydantoinase A
VRRLQAAVDVGGTFIDVVLADAASRELRIAKLLHRRGAQGADILEAIAPMAAEFDADLSEVETIVMGTTVVTNALLEGTVAKTALITTEGFRDVIEIARMTRPSAYDPHRRRATPVVARHLRLEVKERLAHDGEVLTPLDEAMLSRHVETLKQQAVQAVAVSLLFSFVDPSHERRIRDILARELDLPISLSSDLLPVFREYERTTATAINAAAMPLMADFLDGIAALIETSGARAYVMGSAGGCLTFPEARRFPVKCATSGPAGGVIGALQLARRYGVENALTLDVGGTSSDVAMLQGDRLPYTEGRAIGGYPVALSGVEVETVGAGGGSIAFLDRAGLLKVGPKSAGADPGPVCYRRGGTQPTVTDAHLALNRLGARSMLSGDFALDRDAAIHAIETEIAAPLRLTGMAAARGILAVATANIVRAVRTMSVERGYDPRQMTLIAFGGAGPLHAVDVARMLEIPKVLVPIYPGVWSAVGILSSDIQYTVQRTWFRQLADIGADALRAALDELTGDLIDRVRADGIAAEDVRTEQALDLRYRGQSHHLTVDLASATPEGLAAAESSFRREHESRFGHASADRPVELVNLRVTVRLPRGSVESRPKSRAHAAQEEVRSLWLDESGPGDAPVYRRDGLEPGRSIAGPAIVEQYDSTIVLGHGDRLEVLDDTGTALIHVVASAGLMGSKKGETERR